jgi:hypothetical protein
MVESICGQGFAYAREVEEDWTKGTSQTRLEKGYGRHTDEADQKSVPHAPDLTPFIGIPMP